MTGGDDAGRAVGRIVCPLSDVRAARGCAVGCLVRPQLSRLRSVCSPGEAECGAGYSDSSAQSAVQQQLHIGLEQMRWETFFTSCFICRDFYWVLSSPELILRSNITSLKLSSIVGAVDMARPSA